MKNFILLLITIFLTSCETAVVEEVATNGEPEGPHTSAEWKIWAYSSAAPSFIANECTVVDMDDEGNQIVLREGTNGWTAMAANPRGPADPENGWKDAHEAMAMVGDAQSFAWASAYFAGTKPGAHLMLMPKDPSSLDGQTTDFNSGAPYVMFAGTDYAHLMIPVEGYYNYQAKQ